MAETAAVMDDAEPAGSTTRGSRFPRRLLLALRLAGRGFLLGLIIALVACEVSAFRLLPVRHALDWIGSGVVALLAGAAAWILIKPGRSTKFVAWSLAGVFFASLPFLPQTTSVIRLYGFILINLALLWMVVPRLGLVLRRNLRWILLGLGLYLVALSFALSVRDDWVRYHGTGSDHR